MSLEFESVVVYTKPSCTYCVQAKQVLRHYNLPYTEKVLDVDFTREYLLENFPTARTFPVIVVDGFYIGGYSELSENIKRAFEDSRSLLVE